VCKLQVLQCFAISANVQTMPAKTGKIKIVQQLQDTTPRVAPASSHQPFYKLTSSTNSNLPLASQKINTNKPHIALGDTWTRCCTTNTVLGIVLYNT
jgi:hypothetical protein